MFLTEVAGNRFSFVYVVISRIHLFENIQVLEIKKQIHLLRFSCTNYIYLYTTFVYISRRANLVGGFSVMLPREGYFARESIERGTIMFSSTLFPEFMLGVWCLMFNGRGAQS